MRASTFKRTVLTACVAAATVPGTVLAGGGEEVGEAHVAGIVHIRESFPAFHGRVGAENGSCEGPRPVKLFERKRNGERKLLGRTMAADNGKWTILVDPLESGAYFATAPRYRLVDGTVPFLCLRAKSETVVVD